MLIPGKDIALLLYCPFVILCCVVGWVRWWTSLLWTAYTRTYVSLAHARQLIDIYGTVFLVHGPRAYIALGIVGS